jgi:hypothetical protein
MEAGALWDVCVEVDRGERTLEAKMAKSRFAMRTDEGISPLAGGEILDYTRLITVFQSSLK